MIREIVDDDTALGKTFVISSQDNSSFETVTCQDRLRAVIPTTIRIMLLDIILQDWMGCKAAFTTCGRPPIHQIILTRQIENTTDVVKRSPEAELHYAGQAVWKCGRSS